MTMFSTLWTAFSLTGPSLRAKKSSRSSVRQTPAPKMSKRPTFSSSEVLSPDLQAWQSNSMSPATSLSRLWLRSSLSLIRSTFFQQSLSTFCQQVSSSFHSLTLTWMVMAHKIDLSKFQIHNSSGAPLTTKSVAFRIMENSEARSQKARRRFLWSINKWKTTPPKGALMWCTHTEWK